MMTLDDIQALWLDGAITDDEMNEMIEALLADYEAKRKDGDK